MAMVNGFVVDGALEAGAPGGCHARPLLVGALGKEKEKEKERLSCSKPTL